MISKHDDDDNNDKNNHNDIAVWEQQTLHIPDGKSRPEDHVKDSTRTTHTTAAAIELCFDGCRTMYQFLRQHLLLSSSPLDTTTALVFPSTSAAATTTAFMTNEECKVVDDNSHDKRPHKKRPRTLQQKIDLPMK